MCFSLIISLCFANERRYRVRIAEVAFYIYLMLFLVLQIELKNGMGYGVILGLFLEISLVDLADFLHAFSGTKLPFQSLCYFPIN